MSYQKAYFIIQTNNNSHKTNIIILQKAIFSHEIAIL